MASRRWGRFVAARPGALGTGEVLARGGTLAVGADGLALEAPLTVEGGMLELFYDEVPSAGERIVLATAPSIEGAFDKIRAGDLPHEVEQGGTEIALRIAEAG
ncbi:hypothetical protein [Palleronia sp. LCG004]|uniref:hypothetical protein n=1 Tax=Palleronia sp. LCG004 TaxID=3079304 RepID=UPI0029426C76|nr:hypothetical protein [Palleronia sp. LCG004]WOI55864.1 hypothetical protein RVY76_12600 [Palleronia sp. LCG004]